MGIYLNSSNIKINNEEPVIDKTEKNINDWENDSMMEIISNDNDLKELEDEYNNFQQMTSKQKKDSNAKSEELFGMDNISHYDKIKSNLMNENRIIKIDSPDLSYKLNYGTSNRTHYGMTSQDIEKLMDDLGMTSLDFAGFIKSPKTKEVIIKDAEGKDVISEEIIPNEYTYGLRYEEFISPIINVVQQQQKQITTLTDQLADLTSRIVALESK